MDTPYIKVHEEVVKDNIDRMQKMADQKAVHLRPHIKTHKVPAIAKWQLEAGAVGITTAKISEAEVMISEGITNVFIAYPIVTEEKAKRLLVLNKKSTLIVGVDSLDGAELLSRMAEEDGQTIKVRIEVDTGLKRAGIRKEYVTNTAKAIASLPFLIIEGMYTFKGPVLENKPTLDVRAAGLEEGQLLIEYKENLLKEEVRLEVISAGSSPTASSVAEVEGVDEIRPGTYVFNDVMQLKLGLCTEEQCAARVVVTVVSIPDENTLVIDGGSKTFATDVQPNTTPLFLKGFGKVVGFNEAVLERMNEEHGIVLMPPEHGVRVGEQLEIIPNHICSTVNLHNDLYVIKENQEIEKVPVAARGRLQ